MMDKKALLPEIEKIKIKHPRAADFKAKISRQDDCFAMNHDPKSEDCLRCVLRVEYEGQEMSMSECCKKLMTLPLTKTKGDPVPEEKKDVKETPAAGAAEAEKAAPAAQEEKKEAEKATPAEKKKPAAEKKAPVKKPAAPAEKKAPVKKPAAPKAEKAPVKKAPAKDSVEGLGSCQLTILNMLKKKSLTQGDIAEKLDIAGPTANIALGKLLKKGFVTRKPEGRSFIYSAK